VVNSKQKGNRGEVWRDIPGYEGYYQASNNGRIKSVDRVIDHPRLNQVARKSVFIKPYVSRTNGYAYVSLSREGVVIGHRVHRLILNAFLPTVDSEMQCNHINGVKYDNRLINLEWVTQSENMKHAYRTGLQESPRATSVICLDDGVVYKTAKSAARVLGGNSGESVARVCRGERSQYKGKVFAFWDDYINRCIPDFKGKYKKRGVAVG